METQFNPARPQHRNTEKLLCITASIFTILMGIGHFFVPYVFPWERIVEGLYPPVRWALFAMNFFFSLLLIWGGLLTVTAELKWNVTKGMRYWITGGMVLFWAAGAVYEIIFPFPMAEARWILPIIALFISSLYGSSIMFHGRNN